MRLTLQIEALAPGGEGLARAGDRAVYVPYTAPGDLVTVEVGAGEEAVHAELLELVAPGPARQEAACPHFGPAGDRCGGCEWLHVTSLVQLSAKVRALRETLRRIGRLDPAALRWLPPLASPEPLRYRSRAKFHLDRKGGRLVFYRRRSHEPVPLESCALLRPGLEGLRRALGPALAAADLSPREVWLEWSDLQGHGAACLDLAALGERERRRAEGLLAAVPALAGLVLRGPEGVPTLLGQPVLLQARAPGDPAAGACRSRPDVFQQANRGANALLVRAALDLLQPDGLDVLELHCGAGNFTGPLASRARSVAAVEVQGPALDLARADHADQPHPAAPVRFFAGDALNMARAFARELRPKARDGGPAAPRFGALLLDPPREGARGLGPALRELGVPRVVYVSCDPATLARDVKGCVEAGFAVEAVQAVDLFPQTHHVEALVVLTAATASPTEKQ